MDWNGRVALITGASSGIGAATARRLARAGLRVVLVARRRERLEAVAEEIRAAGGEAVVLVADLAEPEERQRVFAQVCALCGDVDVLINNAGLGWYGYAADMPWEMARQMIEVNMAAMVQFTLLFLPRMRRRADGPGGRGRGHIINVGSVAGDLPSQGVAMYSATKSFLCAFTTALYRELRGSGVHISVVKPGPVATEFFERASTRSAGRRMPAERFGVTPERVADRIWSVLNRPYRSVYVPGLLRVVPWIEATLGWLMDLLGPLLLRRAEKPAHS